MDILTRGALLVICRALLYLDVLDDGIRHLQDTLPDTFRHPPITLKTLAGLYSWHHHYQINTLQDTLNIHQAPVRKTSDTF